MPKQLRRFSIYDTLDFPDYAFQEYPKDIQLPNREERLKKAQEGLRQAAAIMDHSLREAAMSIARQELENQTHAAVTVKSKEEEKELLAKWAKEKT